MFGVMYIHTYIWDHVVFSETRAWMALLMGAVMAIIMLGFMLNMYRNRAANTAIFLGAGLAFALSTWLIRSQVTVSGTDYIEAMIPHHSIAILTSERAGIEDPRVRKLADEIIEAQRKEIAEMKYLIRVLKREGVQPARQPEPQAGELPANEAVRTADLAKTDLEPITDAELQRMPPPMRAQRRTRRARPRPGCRSERIWKSVTADSTRARSRGFPYRERAADVPICDYSSAQAGGKVPSTPRAIRISVTAPMRAGAISRAFQRLCRTPHAISHTTVATAVRPVTPPAAAYRAGAATSPASSRSTTAPIANAPMPAPRNAAIALPLTSRDVIE